MNKTNNIKKCDIKKNKVWRNPVILTISQKELQIYIKVAARSGDGSCDGIVGR